MWASFGLFINIMKWHRSNLSAWDLLTEIHEDNWVQSTIAFEATIFSLGLSQGVCGMLTCGNKGDLSPAWSLWGWRHGFSVKILPGRSCLAEAFASRKYPELIMNTVGQLMTPPIPVARLELWSYQGLWVTSFFCALLKEGTCQVHVLLPCPSFSPGSLPHWFLQEDHGGLMAEKTIKGTPDLPRA